MKIFIRRILLFMLPLLPVVATYVYFDPFKVLRSYDVYYVEGDGGYLNKNYVSTMNYINKRDKYHYDSFIFGNSRSMFYMIADWQQHLDDDSQCYHFTESGGSINGLYYKLRLIEEKGDPINNALFVIDYSLLSCMDRDGDGALFIMPPALNRNKNFLFFHLENFLQWTNVDYLSLWFRYRITGKYTDDMIEYIAKDENYKYYNPVTNEEPLHVQDSLISIGKYYDNGRIAVFDNQHRPKIWDSILDDEAIKVLSDIRDILHRNNTDYRIVISPLYDQVTLNPKDIQALHRIFGESHVYDFSGINEITQDYHNYYEPSHYVPRVAAAIMDKVYADQ